MSLDPLCGLIEKVHLFELLVVLLLHDGENLVALLALLDALPVLVVDERELVVHLLELLLRLLLLARLILHLSVVVAKVLSEQTVCLLVLLTHLQLFGLVLGFHLLQLGFESVNAFVECSDFVFVHGLELLVVLTRDLIQATHIVFFADVLLADSSTKGLNLILTTLSLLLRLLLILLELLLLGITSLSELLSAHLQDAQLLLNGVHLLQGCGELGSPEALHVLERLVEGTEIGGLRSSTEVGHELRLKFLAGLEMPDEDRSCFTDLYRSLSVFLGEELIV